MFVTAEVLDPTRKCEQSWVCDVCGLTFARSFLQWSVMHQYLGELSAPALVQIVAVHVQETSLNGSVPCSWADAGLRSIGLLENSNILGPLGLCFSAITERDVNIRISENNDAAPICGSGSDSNVISRQISKCSDLLSTPPVRACVPPTAPAGRQFYACWEQIQPW